VTEALRTVLGDRVVGVCDSPTALCARVAAVLGRDVHDLDWDYAGLNHLGWLLAVRDGERDLLPELLADDRELGSIPEARLFGAERVRALGMLPNEYLIYYESSAEIVGALEKVGRTRAEVLVELDRKFFAADHPDSTAALAAWRRACDERFGSYMAEARDAGSRSGAREKATTARPSPNGDQPGEAGYAAIATAFMCARAGARRDPLILNVANEGSVDCLDSDAVVEVPCDIGVTGVRPRRVGRLPSTSARLVQRVKEAERLTIEAALRGSRTVALRALRAHPRVPAGAVAERILSNYLSSLPELAARLR
jgi:6-phospho-beta-glucosidase